MFDIELFPARDGDCILVRWGTEASPHRLLIDAGRQGTWAALKATAADLPEAERVFELLVVTHIDADHIAGVLKMLEDPKCPLRFKEVWFNGYHHLVDDRYETFGVAQGEKLSDILAKTPDRWNARFKQGAVVVDDPAAPPRLEIEGLKLTLLSPTRAKLTTLGAVWANWLKVSALRREDPEPVEAPQARSCSWETFGARPDVDQLAADRNPVDDEPPNGSSIAFSADFEGHRVLLTGDAHSDVLAAGLAALPAEERRFDLVKLSHHGSRGNLSADLMSAFDARRFAISTDGSHHQHPDGQTIARLIKHRPEPLTFYFNYRHVEAIAWDDATLKARFGYTAVYPDPAKPGRLRISVAPET